MQNWGYYGDVESVRTGIWLMFLPITGRICHQQCNNRYVMRIINPLDWRRKLPSSSRDINLRKQIDSTRKRMGKELRRIESTPFSGPEKRPIYKQIIKNSPEKKTMCGPCKNWYLAMTCHDPSCKQKSDATFCNKVGSISYVSWFIFPLTYGWTH